MKKTRAIFADVDGTLITKGRLENFPRELKSAVAEIRSTRVLFNMASGRPYFEQRMLYELLTKPNSPRSDEAILYEGSALRFFGNSGTHLLGGLSRQEIDEITEFLHEHNLVKGLVPQENNERYETQTGYVTPTFISQGVTDKSLLQQCFGKVKPLVEDRFPYAQVSMSADAIDFFARGLTKAKLVLKYSELTGISLNEMAILGDSGNDMPMFEVVGQAGGITIYVGTDKDQEKTIRTYENHFIPEARGPEGAVKGLSHILMNGHCR